MELGGKWAAATQRHLSTRPTNISPDTRQTNQTANSHHNSTGRQTNHFSLQDISNQSINKQNNTLCLSFKRERKESTERRVEERSPDKRYRNFDIDRSMKSNQVHHTSIASFHSKNQAK